MIILGNRFLLQQLMPKIGQYMRSELFLGRGMRVNALIFTLHTEAKEWPVHKPPYSVYRILLKAIRVWNALEEELRQPLSFTMFCLQFELNSSPSLCHLSANDRGILKNLCNQHPDLSLNEVKHLKNSFLYDTSLAEDRCMERDALFSKRLRTRFYNVADSKEQATLRYRLRQGFPLWVLPNHRLPDYLPFAFWEKYHIPAFLEKLLFHMGLNDLSLWTRTDYGSIRRIRRPAFFSGAYTPL